MKIEDASFKKLSNGKFEITATISAKRFETLKNGEIKEISIDEPIEIGIFSKRPSQIESEDILYLKPQTINKGNTGITLIVDKKPQYISIDPFGTRLDGDRVDNLKEL